MITRATRIMRVEETDAVRRLVRDTWQAAGCLVATFAFSAVVAAIVSRTIALALAEALSIAPEDRFRSGGTGALLGLAVMIFLWRNVRPRSARGLAADLRANEVELVHVHAFAAGTTARKEDYFFDVGDRQVILVRGHAVRAALATGRFPNRYFTLVRLPRAAMTLAIECHGEPLTPSVAHDETAFDLSHIPDATVIPARFETFVGDLCVLVGSGWRP